MSVALSSPGGVTLVGGGAITPDDMNEALARAPVLVAADGGADAAMALDKMPDMAIGDFDSISHTTRQVLGPDRLMHIAEQDSTDFAKSLSRVTARFILAIGFSGRRLDHTLAALNVMVRHPQPPCIMLAAEDIAFRAPPRLELPLASGTRISLFPMGNTYGESTGLRWPVNGIDFAPAGRVGTSNEALGPVSLQLTGDMLVMLPRNCLDLALDALIAPTSA